MKTCKPRIPVNRYVHHLQNRPHITNFEAIQLHQDQSRSALINAVRQCQLRWLGSVSVQREVGETDNALFQDVLNRCRQTIGILSFSDPQDLSESDETPFQCRLLDQSDVLENVR